MSQSLPQPNPGKSLICEIRGGAAVRYPLQTPVMKQGDSFVEIVSGLAAPVLKAAQQRHPEVQNWVIVCAEKALASTQGRAIPLESIRPRPLARMLSKFVTRTPHGIGLGIPETMELALQEVGTPRIMLAAAAAAITKPFGMKGVFYRVAGPMARSIDGPTPYTLPPLNQCVVLGPREPNGVAAALAKVMGVGVAIIDANDLGQDILGAHGLSEDELHVVRQSFRDNPLGQGSERTPVAVVGWYVMN